MAIILSEALETPLHDIQTMNLPYVCYGNGIERLKRILYMARRFLSKHSPAEIKQACADILCLYRRFFEEYTKKLASQLDQSVENTATDLLFDEYLDKEGYVEDSLECLKLSYLSEVDVLSAILQEHQGAVFNKMPGVESNFSNTEFFCVAALYQVSIAITKLYEAQALSQKQSIVQEVCLPHTLESVYDAVLEAQVAIDYACQLSVKDSPELSGFVQAYIKDMHRSLMQKAHHVRYGDKYRLRKAKAIELYEQGTFQSRLNAALHLIDPIQAYSRELGIPELDLGNAQDTIYKWLSAHDKQQTH